MRPISNGGTPEQRGALKAGPNCYQMQTVPGPAVSIAIPAYNEEAYIDRCLEAIEAQDYPNIVEVLVADGRSTDRTRELAAAHDLVRILDNPARNRPAALNVAMAAAKGEIFVRVDARTIVDYDYVSRSVRALSETGAAVVGGPMRFSASNALQRGIASAMTSRLGAGPAQFRRLTGPARFVDTVYLGSFKTATLRALGGYDDVFGGNEDAELNHRAKDEGGVWLDPQIRSVYAVREGLAALWRQFRRYGRARAGTMRKHPASIAPRQLAVPALIVGLISPWRRYVLAAYVAAVVGRGSVELAKDPASAPGFIVALPMMHAAWAVGFAEKIFRKRDSEGSRSSGCEAIDRDGDSTDKEGRGH